MSEPRRLPGIDALLNSAPLTALAAAHGRATVKQALRTVQAQWRSSGRAPDWAEDPAAWANAVAHTLGPGYRPVFNLTGTVIHTNLGRALPPPELFEAVRDLVTRPINLEYDLASGQRGDREAPVAGRLILLTGAEAATVVNNNAAALMLVLNTLARDASVPVSRGELIEIGGSFRLPDIMERAGCRLLEVGTTNRTHPGDYRATASQRPALLLKVHPSNFAMSGFIRQPDTAELAAVAGELGIPLCVDLGSGTLVDLRRWDLPYEPTPMDMLRQGADLVTFSGDKLLGGVQAGLIVGRRELIEACNRNPMKRALRADKVTLVLLERLLALYEEPERLAVELPLLRTLTLTPETLAARAAGLAPLLRDRLPGWQVAVTPCESQIGSGSLPEQRLPSTALRITPAGGSSVEDLHAALRALPVPVLGRIAQGALWLDMRGAEPLEELSQTLQQLIDPS